MFKISYNRLFSFLFCLLLVFIFQTPFKMVHSATMGSIIATNQLILRLIQRSEEGDRQKLSHFLNELRTSVKEINEHLNTNFNDNNPDYFNYPIWIIDGIAKFQYENKILFHLSFDKTLQSPIFRENLFRGNREFKMCFYILLEQNNSIASIETKIYIMQHCQLEVLTLAIHLVKDNRGLPRNLTEIFKTEAVQQPFWYLETAIKTNSENLKLLLELYSMLLK